MPRRRLVTLLGVAGAALTLTATAAPASAADSFPRELRAPLTDVPAHSRAVPVSAGNVTTVDVDFHDGAAVSGRIAATGGQGAEASVVVVVVDKATGKALAGTRTDKNGNWAIGGLPATAVYVCADRPPRESVRRALTPRCYGSPTLWPDASNQAEFTGASDEPGYIDKPRPPVRDVPAGAHPVSLRLGVNTALPTTMTLHTRGSIRARVSGIPRAEFAYYWLFDSSGRIVDSADGRPNQSVVFRDLVAGRYRVCAAFSSAQGSRDVGYAPTCDGAVPWPNAVSPSGLVGPDFGNVPPPRSTKVLTVHDAPVGVPVDSGSPVTTTTFTAARGAAISGTVTFPSPSTKVSVQTSLRLYAGGRLNASTSANPAKRAFVFQDLPPRTDWKICAVAASPGGAYVAKQGQCWKNVAWTVASAKPAAKATAVRTRSGATTSGITFRSSAAPKPGPPRPGTRFPPAVSLSGTVHQSDQTPLQDADVAVFRLYPDDPSLWPYERLAIATTTSDGTWTFNGRPPGTYIQAGDRIQVCASGPRAHPAGKPIPVGSYATHCSAPVTVPNNASGRFDGLDLTLARGGAVLGHLTADGAPWGGSIAVADPHDHAVVVHSFGAPGSGRAVASGVPAAASGYDVCFVPNHRYQVSAAHPTGLLPQCADGQDWYGRDADTLPYGDATGLIY